MIANRPIWLTLTYFLRSNVSRGSKLSSFLTARSWFVRLTSGVAVSSFIAWTTHFEFDIKLILLPLFTKKVSSGILVSSHSTKVGMQVLAHGTWLDGNNYKNHIILIKHSFTFKKYIVYYCSSINHRPRWGIWKLDQLLLYKKHRKSVWSNIDWEF